MKERFIWINRVKLLACILVVLGHFLSGLIISNIIKNNIFCINIKGITDNIYPKM